jgi:hypothetical protein
LCGVLQIAVSNRRKKMPGDFRREGTERIAHGPELSWLITAMLDLSIGPSSRLGANNIIVP